MMLAHAASALGISVVEQLCGMDNVLNHLSVPAACFTHPEISMVGFTEPQAREKAEKEGFEISVAKTSFKANTKALAENEGEGLAKLIYMPDTGEILGVHILGLHAADLIHEGSNAIALGSRIQAVGHGISTSLLDAVQELSTEFFKLPLQEKKKWLISPDEDALQGYGNDVDGSDEQILNWSDRLYLVVLPEENRKLKFWPENPPTFRKILHEYTTNVKHMADQILRTMAESVGLKEDYFIDCFGQRSGMFVRFNYYPPCPRPDLVLGIQAHSDAAGITIVLQDKEVRGLQVLKEEKWLEIPIIPHALLVNLGDQMEIMSNGIFKSPVHRVVTNSEKERMSVAMFYAPNPEQEIEPAEGLIDEEKPRLYKKVIVKDYLAAFVDSYMHGKRAIHNVKISGMHA